MRQKANALLSHLSKNQLFKNVSWLLVAEGLARASRLVTLFVLASFFTNAQYGVAMLAVVCHELFRVFTRIGTGAKIIQCLPGELPAMLKNAATLQWVVAILVAVLQITTAEWVSDYYRNPDLADLLTLMALSHLFYPLVAIRIFELQRRNELRYYGIASGFCIALENFSVAAFVFADWGIMAVAYCKVLAGAIWVALFLRLPSQCEGRGFDLEIMSKLLSFATKTLFSELGRTLRYHIDSLFAARLLSPEMFGLYSFAKSAALGIGQSLSLAYMAGLYPYLCKKFRAGQVREASTQAAIATGLATTAFLAQAALAPYYIVWLFDQRWIEATTIASTLCLCAIPMLLLDHQCVKQRALGKAGIELKLIVVSNILLTLMFGFGQFGSPMDIAIGFLCACGLSSLLCVFIGVKVDALKKYFWLSHQLPQSTINR